MLSIDPFADIDRLATEPTINNNESAIPEEEIIDRGYARDWHDDSDEEWEMESQNKTRSAFDIFDDVNNDEEWRFITNITFNIKCFSLFWTLFWIKIYVYKFKDLIYVSSFLEALNFNVTYSW